MKKEIKYTKIKYMVFCLVLCLPYIICYEASAMNLKHYLQIFNKEEFDRFKNSLTNHLIYRDIIKNENSYTITHSATSSKEQMGLELFNKLDYSFILTHNQSNEPRYFTSGSYSNLLIEQNSFSLQRGSDHFKAEVIAKLNWDKKDKEDWLVFFSLTNPHSELVGRYFYLIVTDTKTAPLKTKVLASQNNLTNTFLIYEDEMPEYKIQLLLEENGKSEDAKKIETNTRQVEIREQRIPKESEQSYIELDRGQYSVLESPNQADDKAEKKVWFWQKKKEKEEISIETKLEN